MITPPGVIRGRVHAWGEGLSAVTVQAIGKDTVVVQTDPLGLFDTGPLRRGTYDVRVGPDERVAWVPSSERRVVVPSGEAQADFYGRPTPAPEWAAIEVGRLQTCGVTMDGDAYCWGQDSAPSSWMPLLIGESGQSVSVSIGEDYRCFLNLRGDAACQEAWGWIGGTPHGPTPFRTYEGLSLESVSVGGYYTSFRYQHGFGCGVSAGGSAYCWGNNEDGQLGDGTRIRAASPVAVEGGNVFEQLATGHSHTCGRSNNGEVYCWGRNASGQLGTGRYDSSDVPVPIEGDSRWIGLSARGSTTCALAESGEAHCWGGISGFSGPSPTPVLVANVPLRDLFAGAGFACGLTYSDEAYCWGANSQGQLGLGWSSAPVTTPLPMAGSLRFLTLSLGDDMGCGVTLSSEAYCWGSFGLGEVGQPSG